MTQAQKTFSGTTSLLPTALAAIVAAAAVSTAIVLVQYEAPATSGQAATTQTNDQALINAGRAWEEQRIQQSAFGAGTMSNAVMDAAHEWERQRIQQSPGGLGGAVGTHSPTAPAPR